MKVLQTLGPYNKDSQVGIFQYRRVSAGVEIIPIDQIGKNSLNSVIIPHDNWLEMLSELAGDTNTVHGLTALKNNLKKYLGKVTGLHNNHMPAVAAILEHEGSIDHYGGKIGRNKSAIIYLRTETN